MSLLAGVRFAKKKTQQAGERGKAQEDGRKTIDGETVVDDNELQHDHDLPEKGKKRKHKHRKKGKGSDELDGGDARIKISSKDRKKAKADDGPHTSDGQQHASKRRKSDGNVTSSPAAAASGGVDWIDQALAVGKKSKGDDTATAEELAKRARDEEIDLEVVKGLRDPKTKRRYGLFDPLKAEKEREADRTGGPTGGEEAGSITRGGGSLDGGAGGGGGLPGTFAPRLLSGVGDKGAGWRAKALKRAREKAEKTGQSLEELVGGRWGSLDQLKRDSRGGGAGRGRHQAYSRGRDELASLAASEGRIAPEESASLIGQVGKGGSRSRSDRKDDGDDRGGRGGRERKLRIGRDAKDTDVLKRFSSKLEDALSRNDDTRRDEDHRGHSYREGAENKRGSNDQRGDTESEPKTDRHLGWREQEARSSRDPVDRECERGDEDRGNEPDGAWHLHGAGETRGGIDSQGASRRRERWSESKKSRDERQLGGRDSRERSRLDGGSHYRKERGGSSRDRWRRDDSRDRSGKSMVKGEEARRDHFDGERRAGDSEARRVKGERGDNRDRGSSGDGRRREREDGVDTDAIGTARGGRMRKDGNPTEANEDSRREDRLEGERRDAEELDGRDRAKHEERRSGLGLVDRQRDAETSVDRDDPNLKAPSIPAAGKEADGKAEDSMKSGNGALVEGSKLLSEAELTKLAVAAMKAKLKGDTATHARLTEEARRGREAIAAAAAVAAQSPEAPVRAASPGRWKPGLDPKETKEGDGQRGRDGRYEGWEAESRDDKGGDDEDEVEIVTGFDENGRPLRAGKAELMREDLKSGRRKGKLKEAAGRWAEGANESVAEFVKREREQGFENMDETFLRNVSRLGSKFRGTELGGAHTGLAGEDEEEEVDMRMFQRPEDRMTAMAAAERLRAKAIADHRRQSAATSRCYLCMDSAVFKKHLVLSLGEHTFLYLATGIRRLSDGHCYIVPIRHTPASTACDEDVWREIDLFKGALRKMVAGSSTSSPPPSPTTTAPAAAAAAIDKTEKNDRKKHKKKAKKEKRRSHKEAVSRTGEKVRNRADDEDYCDGVRGGGNASGDGDGVIFLETGGKPGSSSAKHAFIEAAVVPRSAASDAPMYFKQALMEAGEEWSTHKKCITADPRRGGVRRAVPKGFPYFHVEWDDGGYAHVIEGEEGKFPRNFGVDTLAGVMGIDPPSFGGKGRGHGGGSAGVRGAGADEQERKMVIEFLERWKKFDWTSELDGGEYQEGTA